MCTNAKWTDSEIRWKFFRTRWCDVWLLHWESSSCQEVLSDMSGFVLWGSPQASPGEGEVPESPTGGANEGRRETDMWEAQPATGALLLCRSLLCVSGVWAAPTAWDDEHRRGATKYWGIVMHQCQARLVAGLAVWNCLLLMNKYKCTDLPWIDSWRILHS